MKKVLALLAFAGAAHAEGNVEAGRALAETCLGCHGVAHYVNTYPTYHVPKLKGQHAEYIVEALKGYRSGERAHETMHANAAQLSDQDIADIAAYIASIK
ncbi:MAG: cytochrome c [Gammaproteobacteria bacterium]|nr:cytochrome c [Gammaproteobacteria bacterium]